ncbi:hypothetical protein JKY72_04710 [Candidatus Gracilibacteria bacterium]|nr:hypothetical protein [Candidatus Gracilibacteria bacterium]
MKSLKLRGAIGGQIRMGGSLTRRAKGSANSDALAKLQMLKSGKDSSAIDAMKANAKKAADERERMKQEEAQAVLRDEFFQKIIKEFRIKLLLSFDFTYSTSGDIGNIVNEGEELVRILREEFPQGIEVLPVAVRGEGHYGHNNPDVVVGAINDLGHYKSVRNIGYNAPTPVAHGVVSGSRDEFFAGGDSDEKLVQAAVTIGDEYYEIPDDYRRDVIERFNRDNIHLAGLVTVDNESAINSHEAGIVEPLKEGLGYVVKRSDGEISAVQLIAIFLTNIRDNIANVMAQKELETYLARQNAVTKIAAIKRTGLAQSLKRRGLHREARNVIGKERKMLGE